MDVEATKRIIADLRRAFPLPPIDLDAWGVYVRHCADIPPDALAEAVAELIRTSDRRPPVSAIRRVAAERTLALPTEEQALSQVEARMAWGRDSGGEPPEVHELVRRALDHVGGYHALRSAEEPVVVRGQFLRLFRGLREVALREVQVGELAQLPSGPPVPELTP